MKWLQDNPVGLTLIAISAVCALLVLAMAIIWNIPVPVETSGVAAKPSSDSAVVITAHEVDTLSSFQVINEKPVFNESRQPEMQDVVVEDELVDTAVEVKDAPDVRLTGVIITPSMKIASLTPADAKLESVMAHEGEALTGEFVGWLVSTVSPRTVLLESRDGQKLELDLQIHDAKIKEPPKAPKPTKTAQATAAQNEPANGGDGEPLSRAEQIRQRIAERREELRLEQEAQQAQNGAGTGAEAKQKPQDYQSAIRSMMGKNVKDKSSDDKE